MGARGNYFLYFFDHLLGQFNNYRSYDILDIYIKLTEVPGIARGFLKIFLVLLTPGTNMSFLKTFPSILSGAVV